MARIFTTPDTEIAAKVFMHNVTVAGGLNTNNLQKGRPWFFTDREFISDSQTICNELVDRDFNNIDSAIKSISRFHFYPNYQNLGKRKSFKPEAVAKAIVYMAELLGIYWDDTIRTPYEIDEFKKTLLGTAVFKYGRVISAVSSKATRGASSTRTPGQPPKNNYKQSGPQSSNVRDLQDLSGNPGTPGQKVTANSSLIFRIIGDDPMSKNVPNVFIKPLSASGAAGNTNKIFISSGNGYTDCTCYFDDLNDADAFLNKIISNNRVPVNVSNLRVVKGKADPNGYFIVGTEFGPCAIAAKKLNEALAETLEENTDSSSGWEKATKDYTNEELNELHAWMRRD